MTNEPPGELLDLVERFERNLKAYKSPSYKEHQLRIEFINPFFECLEWDVSNKKGAAPQYRDVIFEDSIKTQTGTKAPDYCFTLAGRRMFFVEAKKPSISIKTDIHPAYQLRRYAWSAKLPLAILTDFEEFAIFESRCKPNKKDKASTERVFYCTYDEYLDNWDEISNLFLKTSVLQGSLDNYILSLKGKRGTAEVDSEFLSEIEDWRSSLAKNIALRNSEISVGELNYSVQKIIDRTIFLRMCEDRGIEPYGQLLNISQNQDIYSNLCKIFLQADEKYNSGLFHFQNEKGRSTCPDIITLSLDVDDKVLKPLLKNIYYPDSPYEFSVLSSEILGNVYEQFLGKIIRLTPGHRAKIEFKPDVKKAGGVFYTPPYIVHYIVEQTIGPICKDLSLKQISKIRILDPACGSGSFLLTAYAYLLKWYLRFYSSRKSNRYKDQVYLSKHGEMTLTIKEKKRILLQHIFGVDIDAQAVEVTKLSLLLKVLEGEHRDVFEQQQKLWRERALPDLDTNIKCGNSLIGPEFHDGGVQSHIDEELIYRVNTFDWFSEFPEIMTDSGYDVIIGNPPYVDIKSLPDIDVQYLFNHYPTANNRINLFALFIDRGLDLVKTDKFRLSMIIPTAFLTQDSYKSLRKKILDLYRVVEVIRLPNESFGSHVGDVKVDTAIIILSNQQKNMGSVRITGYTGYDRISKIDATKAHIRGRIKQESWHKQDDCVWSIYLTDIDKRILTKCEDKSIPLIEIADFCLGITPYDKYQGHTQEQIKNKVFHSPYKKDDTFKNLLAGNDVERYYVKWNGEQWISYGPWLGAQREQRFFNSNRIIVKQIIDWSSKRIWATVTDEELYNTQNAFVIIPKEEWDIHLLLGILNSRLLSYYHRKRYLDEGKMRFQKILIKDCKQFPIRSMDKNKPENQQLYDGIIRNVKTMIALKEKVPKLRVVEKKDRINRELTRVDKIIDKLVYKLYGITDREIEHIESQFI